MFETHQATIATYARQGPDELARIMQFVLLSIRTPLKRVPQDMVTCDEGGEDAMSVLWGFKHSAWSDLYARREITYTFLEHIAHGPGNDQERACAMLGYLCHLPGLGPAKAGFVIQLAYGLAGCLDGQNLKQYNIPEQYFAAGKFKRYKQTASRARLVREYVAQCYTLGGPAILWDNWCRYIVDHSLATYDSADQASALHCVALNLPH